MNQPNLELKIRQQQKIIFQLNDLISVVIDKVNKQFPDFKKEVNETFENIKPKIYSIRGTIKKTKYNIS